MNEHLDAIDAEICRETQDAREQFKGLSNGDLVIWPNGEKRRISHLWDHFVQTTKTGQGSWYISRTGKSQFSGALCQGQLREYFQATGDHSFEEFWFFHHGRSGAGRGVRAKLQVPVWRFSPTTMTHEQARAHPAATRSLEVWGSEDFVTYQELIRELMQPKVITNPENY